MAAWIAERLLPQVPTTLAGIELESRYNQWLIRHPRAREHLYARAARPAGGQEHRDDCRCVLVPSIHHRAGVGHRVSSWISAFQLARANGLELVRLPWRDAWDTWLGLDEEHVWDPAGAAVTLLPPVAHDDDGRGAALFDQVLQSGRQDGRHYRLALDHFAWDQSAAFDELARRYWDRHERQQSQKVTVLIHVRRGDVTDAMGERFRGVAYFEQQLRAVQTVLEALRIPWEGVVLCQGDGSDVSSLLLGNVRMGTGTSEFDDFHAMCCSDVLIASPSSFSMTAGMISGGLVLRPEQWFHAMPAADRWVGVGPDGQVDVGLLRARAELTVARTRS